MRNQLRNSLTKLNKYLTDKDIEDFFNKSEQIFPEFECLNCHKKVSERAPGTKNRNHCPYCLYSRHVDKNVGDRQSKCLGKMKAIGKFLRPNGEEVLIHECEICGNMSNNRVAGDDDIELVKSLKVLDKQSLL